MCSYLDILHALVVPEGDTHTQHSCARLSDTDEADDENDDVWRLRSYWLATLMLSGYRCITFGERKVAYFGGFKFHTNMNTYDGRNQDQGL